MERQNSKQREKHEKAEAGRVRKLVDNSYKKDPRLARMRERAAQAKLDKKKAREEQKLKEQRGEAVSLCEE